VNQERKNNARVKHLAYSSGHHLSCWPFHFDVLGWVHTTTSQKIRGPSREICIDDAYNSKLQCITAPDDGHHRIPRSQSSLHIVKPCGSRQDRREWQQNCVQVKRRQRFPRLRNWIAAPGLKSLIGQWKRARHMMCLQETIPRRKYSNPTLTWIVGTVKGLVDRQLFRVTDGESDDVLAYCTHRTLWPHVDDALVKCKFVYALYSVTGCVNGLWNNGSR
jgi:hypothetical protein